MGRNVVADRWTFQIVEDFDANYWTTFRDFDARARDELPAATGTSSRRG